MKDEVAETLDCLRGDATFNSQSAKFLKIHLEMVGGFLTVTVA